MLLDGMAIMDDVLFLKWRSPAAERHLGPPLESSEPDLDAAPPTSHLKRMTEQGQRMQCLIEGMPTLSRLESVDYPLRPGQVDMRAMMGAIADKARSRSSGKHEVTLSVDGPDVKGSAKELRSAFANLAWNAVRYAGPGARIRLSWQNSNAGPQFVASDTGIDIDQVHIARLTERFYRDDKSRSRETHGTGLGLPDLNKVTAGRTVRAFAASPGTVCSSPHFRAG